jgi:glycosyltransferase involved in cell wall biosynthesis
MQGVVGHGVLRLDMPDEHERLNRLFAEATCFVMPSHAEAVGIAYVEAAAAGLPSIGTSRGGADYLIGDGGLIVDPGDDEALVEAMRRLSDPGTAARTGEAARRRSELFTWGAVARRLLRALEGAPAESPDAGLRAA